MLEHLLGLLNIYETEVSRGVDCCIRGVQLLYGAGSAASVAVMAASHAIELGYDLHFLVFVVRRLMLLLFVSNSLNIRVVGIAIVKIDSLVVRVSAGFPVLGSHVGENEAVLRSV
jgi:hypothetical protein